MGSPSKPTLTFIDGQSNPPSCKGMCSPMFEQRTWPVGTADRLRLLPGRLCLARQSHSRLTGWCSLDDPCRAGGHSYVAAASRPCSGLKLFPARELPVEKVAGREAAPSRARVVPENQAASSEARKSGASAISSRSTARPGGTTSRLSRTRLLIVRGAFDLSSDPHHLWASCLCCGSAIVPGALRFGNGTHLSLVSLAGFSYAKRHLFHICASGEAAASPSRALSGSWGLH